MSLHHLTDRHLHHIHVDPVLPGLGESFADPPERMAKLRGRASIIRIGRGVLDYGRAFYRYRLAVPGTPDVDQAERDALDALDAMTKSAEVAVTLGDPFKVGRPVLRALEPLTRAARMGRPMTLDEASAVLSVPPVRRGWNRAMWAILMGLSAVPDVEPVDSEMLDARETLAKLGGLP